MPRSPNLKRELEIWRLRSEEMTVRDIAKMVHASPSTVSRVLRKDPNRATLATQGERLQTVERKLEVTAEALALITNILLEFHGPRPKQRMLDLLSGKWPDRYFTSAVHNGRL